MSTIEQLSKQNMDDILPSEDELSKMFAKLSIDFDEAFSKYERLVDEFGEEEALNKLRNENW